MGNNAQIPDLERVKDLMKKMKLIKGQLAHIATCDSEGRPNLAPVGSMRITENGNVHVIQGFLPKTFSNLKQNPKATFSVFKLPGVFGLFNLFLSNKDEALGYRVYCDFIEALDDQNTIEHETTEILKKFPWMFRKPFSSFAKETFKRVLVFKVKDIRATM